MIREIKLKEPINIDGHTVETIKIRSPKVKDIKDAMLAAKDDPMEGEIALIAKLSELTIEQVEEMEMANYVLLQEAVSDFLGRK